MKIRPRRIVSALGVIVLLIAGYVGWQIYQGQQMAKIQTPTTPSSQSTPPTDVPASVDYKQFMTKTYQQLLQEVQVLQSNTLALQGGKISLSSYKSSVLQSQATFSSAEAFVQANPPMDAKLKAPYQEFLAGVSLAKQATGVVLEGIASFSVSKVYTARDMGVTAQQQVEHGYSQL